MPELRFRAPWTVGWPFQDPNFTKFCCNLMLWNAIYKVTVSKIIWITARRICKAWWWHCREPQLSDRDPGLDSVPGPALNFTFETLHMSCQQPLAVAQNGHYLKLEAWLSCDLCCRLCCSISAQLCSFLASVFNRGQYRQQNAGLHMPYMLHWATVAQPAFGGRVGRGDLGDGSP